jgi:probable phosphoglycerate mutase
LGQPIYFVRHGETDWNAEARLQGQRDIPLNDLGRVQSEEAGRKIAALHPNPEDLDYLCSPLLRTRETMEIARKALGLHPTYYRQDTRLKELAFGDWEGLTWKEVRKTDPAGARAREASKWQFQPPGGESYAMLASRVMPVFAELDPARPTVVVSHGGVMRCALALLCGVSRRDAPALDIWQGRVLVVTNGTYQWV